MAKNNALPIILEEAGNINYNMYIIALIVVIISFFVLFIYHKKRTVRQSILFMGLSDSGKTLLFSQLLHSKFVSTYTSIKENQGQYAVNNKTLRIVDIPGQERLRSKFFDLHKNNAKGIVYVCDSLTLQKEVRDVAESLYVILTDPVILSITPKILILCNKQDEMLSKASSVIKSLLEKEINTLRVTQSSQLESVDNSKKKITFLGKAEKEFDFSFVPPFTVEFAESQACEESPNIDELKNWLSRVV